MPSTRRRGRQRGATLALNLNSFPLSPGGTPATLDFDFSGNRYWNAGTVANVGAAVTVTRASGGTNLFPVSASGFAYTTFGNNTARQTTGSGLIVEESRVNRLLNSAAPVTQTTASLGTGTYTLWVNGSGSATSSAGSATGSGFGAATQGVPNNFTLTGAGTVTVTVAGSLNAFQLELGLFGTSLIVTAGAVVTRAADVVVPASALSFGTAYTIFGAAVPEATAAFAAIQRLLTLDDGTTSNVGTIQRAASTGNAGYNLTIGGSNTAATITAWTQNVAGKLALASQVSDQAGCFNRISMAARTAGQPALTSTRIGSNTLGVSLFNGVIQRVAIWPMQRLSNAKLMVLTA